MHASNEKLHSLALVRTRCPGVADANFAGAGLTLAILTGASVSGMTISG